MLGLAVAGRPRPFAAPGLGLAVTRRPWVSVLTGATLVLRVVVVVDSVSFPLFAYPSVAGPPPSPTTYLGRTGYGCVLSCLQEAFPTTLNGFQSETEKEPVQSNFRHLCVNYRMNNIVIINLLKYSTKN